MLENQLIVRAGFQEQRKLVKAFYPAKQLGAIDQIDCDRRFLSPGEIEKAILNVLW